jgi:CubicO group peptidase (beta-lactamase class C family)
MKNIHVFAYLFLLAASFCFVQDKGKQIEKLVSELHERGQFNGSILVPIKGEIIYSGGKGVANFEKSIPFTSATPTYIASLSKQFAAMAVMILVEKKKLTYEDKLSKYFPEFPLYAHKITIKNLLNHTSGIPDYFHLGLAHMGLTNEEVLKGLIKQDSSRFPPGDKFEYSNSGYVLLASRKFQAFRSLHL